MINDKAPQSANFHKTVSTIQYKYMNPTLHNPMVIQLCQYLESKQYE